MGYRYGIYGNETRLFKTLNKAIEIVADFFFALWRQRSCVSLRFDHVFEPNTGIHPSFASIFSMTATLIYTLLLATALIARKAYEQLTQS